MRVSFCLCLHTPVISMLRMRRVRLRMFCVLGACALCLWDGWLHVVGDWQALGFTNPTPIQAKSIPFSLQVT